jgi:hypothetical protein
MRRTRRKWGKLIGAKMLITGKLYRRPDNYELFLQLLRVDTAEVLSVTRAKIDFNLGFRREKTGTARKRRLKNRICGSPSPGNGVYKIS